MNIIPRLGCGENGGPEMEDRNMEDRFHEVN